MYRSGEQNAHFQLTAGSRGAPPGRGSNSEAARDLFWAPLTLEQAVPALRNAPGSAITALADDIFDLTGPSEQVRVNSREYDTSGTDRTYRRPDARVGDVAFDVTLSQKTAKTAQVRGFFSSDFRPQRVVIVRPSQLGPGSTYAIARPGR